MLLPWGFFLYACAFWRIQENMLWVVGMNEAGVIAFQIIHFSHGLFGELPWSGLWQLIAVMPKGSVYSLEAAACFFREALDRCAQQNMDAVRSACRERFGSNINIMQRKNRAAGKFLLPGSCNIWF